MSTDAQKKAIELAQHYFAAVAGMNGMPWSADNDAEVELMVTYIIDAAAASARRTVHEDLQMHARMRGTRI